MPRPLRIGLVFSYSLAHCRGIVRGVGDYARAKRDWLFTPIPPEAGGLKLLREAKPDGVIAHVYNETLAEALLVLRKPLVNVCGVLPDLAVPRVGLDDVVIGRLAADHLLDRGLRHFAFVGQPHQGYSRRREAGFRRRVAAAGFRLSRYHEPRTAFDPRGRLWALDEAVRRWVGSLPRPVGVFTCNDVWGVQISEVCRQAKLNVPEDVAIVGVDNDDLLCELARPPLSSVAIPSEQVGYRAAVMLDGLLRGKPAPRRPVLLPPRGVVARQSSDVLAIDDPDVAAAVRFIRAEAGRPLATADVVDAVTVCRRTLERRFRRALARGIWDEIRRVQLDLAKRLLCDTDLPMSTVAQSSGLSDGKHLSVVFRQELNVTPTGYRQQFKKAQGTRSGSDAPTSCETTNSGAETGALALSPRAMRLGRIFAK
jgi:LacI family transcriptional regulator